MKSLTLYFTLLLAIAFAACKDDSIELPIEETPACVIESITFEDNTDNPHLFEYQENGNLISVEDAYQKHIFIYENNKLTQVDVKYLQELARSHSITLEYNGKNISGMKHTYGNGEVWLIQKFIYKDNKLNKLEWYREEGGEMVIHEQFSYSVEAGNIIGRETITYFGDGATSDGLETYEYYEDENPLQGNMSMFIISQDEKLFFNTNLIKTTNAEPENHEHYITSYSYELNTEGFPVVVNLSNKYTNQKEYKISYICKND